MSFEKKMEELFIELPEPPKEFGCVTQISKTGRLVYLSGQLPYADGRLAYKGRVGLELPLDKGRAAARAALIQSLGVLKTQLGSIDKIKRFVHLKLYIATGGEFKDHKKVLDGASELINDIFGLSGKCSAEVVGCASLPEGAAVEISVIVELK